MLNGLNKGAVDFLVKPVDPLTVQERICGCVRRAWQPGSTILDGPEPAADTEQPAAPVDTLTEAEYWDRLLELFFQARPNLSPAKYHALGRISAALAEGLCKAVPTCGLTLEEAQLIGRAAAYCDVGLLGIPDNIIEMGQDQGGSGQEVYFRHTALGHALFTTGPSSSRPLARYAAEIAYWHHKNFDGTGYPTEESAAPIPPQRPDRAYRHPLHGVYGLFPGLPRLSGSDGSLSGNRCGPLYLSRSLSGCPDRAGQFPARSVFLLSR